MSDLAKNLAAGAPLVAQLAARRTDPPPVIRITLAFEEPLRVEYRGGSADDCSRMAIWLHAHDGWADLVELAHELADET